MSKPNTPPVSIAQPLRPKQLIALLAAAIPAGLPVLVTGSPGIGKSDIVGKAAADAGADVILSHPVVADPTDAKGLPWPSKDGDSATFLPFGDLAQAIKATKPTVWFLDDLGQAPPAVQASFMQLLLARSVNGHALPDCVTFVAATNRRTDRAGVSGILEPVKSRFVTIVELTTDIEDWSEWAFDNDIPAELIAFLRLRTDLLNAFQPSADLTNSPVPRTWSNVAKILKLGLDDVIQRSAIAGAVGEGQAAEFAGFLRIFKELPTIDEVLNNPKDAIIPDQPASLYAIVTGLGTRCSTKTFPNIAVYAERLAASDHGEFGALLIRDCVRRDKGIMKTQPFVRIAAGEIGRLMASGDDN